MSGTRIILAGDAAFEHRLRQAMPELNGNLHRWSGTVMADDVDTPVAHLLTGAPELVAFGPGLVTETVLEVAAELDRLRPDIEIVLVAEPAPLVWQLAAQAGVREVVDPDADDEELAGAFRRAMATVERRRTTVAPPPPPPPPPRPENKVVVVLSPKGGSGKTMVSSNLAVALAKAHPGSVAIVDLDLQFGDVATSLRLAPEYTIADATSNASLDSPTLKALLSTHPSHLYALCAPLRPGEADDITGDDVAAVLDLLQSEVPFVVVDTAGGLDEHTLAAVDAATDIVFVCSMDVSSVRALRKELDALDALGITEPRRVVVLNRADSRVGLEVADIEATIGRSIDLTVSSSRAVPLAMNRGEPVIDAEPSSKVAKDLRKLAEHLAPAPAAAGRTWRRRR